MIRLYRYDLENGGSNGNKCNRKWKLGDYIGGLWGFGVSKNHESHFGRPHDRFVWYFWAYIGSPCLRKLPSADVWAV